MAGQGPPGEIPIAARAVAELTIPGSADFLTLEGDGAWVTNEGRVERLVRRSARPVASVPIGEPCGAMAVDFGSLWAMNCKDGSLVRIDLVSRRIVATIATGVADPSGELSIAAGAGSIWLLTDSAGTLSRIDPAGNAVVARIPVRSKSYAAAFGVGSVWITNTAAGSIQRIDPIGQRVTATIPVGPTPRFLAVGVGGVWTLNQGDGTVTRVDPVTNRVAAIIPVGVAGTGGNIAAGAGRVWVRATRRLLSAIDPANDRVVARYGPPAGSGAVRASDRLVWVTAHDIHKVWIIRP